MTLPSWWSLETRDGCLRSLDGIALALLRGDVTPNQARALAWVVGTSLNQLRKVRTADGSPVLRLPDEPDPAREPSFEEQLEAAERAERGGAAA